MTDERPAVIAMPIARMPTYITPDSIQMACTRCDQLCWVGPDSMDFIAWMNARIICLDCAPEVIT